MSSIYIYIYISTNLFYFFLSISYQWMIYVIFKAIFLLRAQEITDLKSLYKKQKFNKFLTSDKKKTCNLKRKIPDNYTCCNLLALLATRKVIHSINWNIILFINDCIYHWISVLISLPTERESILIHTLVFITFHVCVINKVSMVVIFRLIFRRRSIFENKKKNNENDRYNNLLYSLI